MDSAVIGATVAVGEGQDLLNLRDPVVIKLQSTRIQQKLVSCALLEKLLTFEPPTVIAKQLTVHSRCGSIQSMVLYCTSRSNLNPALSSNQCRTIQIQDVYLGTSVLYVSP